MAKKKLLSGNGWSFEPAGAAPEAEAVSLPPERQKARVALEKRAKGKEVTLVTGFVLSASDRKALSARLKKACGSGGSESGAGIEVQGDHRETVRSILAGMGWTVR